MEEPAKALHVLQVSDIHGFVYGHSHIPELGDLGTVYSYKQRLEQQLAQRVGADGALNESLAAIVAGDVCEGTGLSDMTDPKCHRILEAVAATNPSVVIAGNHDVTDSGTVAFIHNRQKELFNGSYITTNVFLKPGDGEAKFANPMGNRFKYETMPNGLRVLYLSFLVYNYQDWKLVDVPSHVEAINLVNETLMEYGGKTDVLVLVMHVDSYNNQLPVTLRKLRDFFNDTFGYDVPILMSTAHSHGLMRDYCNVSKSSDYGDADYENQTDHNCYMTEAGYQLRNVVHMRYTFAATEYFNKRLQKNTVGYRLAAVDEVGCSNENKLTNVVGGKDCGLAARFGLAPAEFQTADARALMETVDGQVAALGLAAVHGRSKFTYPVTRLNRLDEAGKEALQRDNTTLYALWTYAVFPRLVYNASSPCRGATFTNLGSLREPLPAGDLTLDDIRVIYPFGNTFRLLAGLPAADARVALEQINLVRPGVDYSVATQLGAGEEGCVDLYFSSYDEPALLQALAAGGLAYGEGAVAAYRPADPRVRAYDDLLLAFADSYLAQPAPAAEAFWDLRAATAAVEAVQGCLFLAAAALVLASLCRARRAPQGLMRMEVAQPSYV